MVTFHSLEDRIVKQFLARRSGRGRGRVASAAGRAGAGRADFRVAAGQPIVPGAAELAANPRARSAKLRFGERTAAPAAAETRDSTR